MNRKRRKIVILQTIESNKIMQASEMTGVAVELISNSFYKHATGLVGYGTGEIILCALKINHWKNSIR